MTPDKKCLAQRDGRSECKVVVVVVVVEVKVVVVVAVVVVIVVVTVVTILTVVTALTLVTAHTIPSTCHWRAMIKRMRVGGMGPQALQ